MPVKLALLALAASSCLAQTELRQYLSLTAAQANKILQLNSDYRTYVFGQDQRTNTLNGELQQFLSQPAPDPQQVGNRAAEIETIRRDEVSRQGMLQKNAAAQLTPAQTTLVQNLIASAILLPLAADAQCAYLVRPISVWFDTSVFVPGFVGSFSAILSPYPFPVAPTPGPFCGSQVFPISVREYLSLTDTQIASIYQAGIAYSDFYTRSQNRLAELRNQTDAMLAAGNADATVLGLLYAEIARIPKEIQARSAQLRDQAQTQLTPAQSQKVKVLQDAENLQDTGVINNAINCNLLLLPVGSANSGTMLNGGGSYCSL